MGARDDVPRVRHAGAEIGGRPAGRASLQVGEVDLVANGGLGDRRSSASRRVGQGRALVEDLGLILSNGVGVGAGRY